MTSDSNFNTSGFNLQPAGVRWYYDASYSITQAYAYLWSSTDVPGGTAYYRAFWNTNAGIINTQDLK